MDSLEQLVKQEYQGYRLEGLLVFYSVSTQASPLHEHLPSESNIHFDNISDYADSLNKQFGVPSPSVTPRTSSTSVSLETFNPQEITESLNKPYKTSVNEEEIAYAINLNNQSNVPSPVIKPVTSHAPDPKTFDFGPVLDAINNPFCPSHSSNPFTASSSPVKLADAPVYDSPEFKTPDLIAPKFEPVNVTSYKEGVSDILSSKPYEYLDNFGKNEIKILTKDICTKSDFYNVLDLFKNNDLPNIYERIKQNLNMKPKSVTAIILTNPLNTESMDEEGPVFLERNNGAKEIRLPVTQPKFIPFIKTDKQKYRDMLLNSFLPHEQAHANINKKYGPIGEDKGLAGFNEHLADTMAKDSLGNPYIKAETEYQNMWAGPSEKKSEMAKNYATYLSSDELASKVPANIATINILGNHELKKKTDNILNSTLKKIYPDEKLRENVLNNIYDVSEIYQTEAFKLTELSKKDTILSNFKAKRILSEVEKRTYKFSEEL